MPALIVSDELPPAVTDVGLSVAVAAVGAPETVSEIVSALPEITAVLMVEPPDPPGASETLAGDALIEKSLVTGPQFGNLKVPMRVFQLNAPFVAMYWLVYQNVQSSPGSTAIML